MGVIIRFEEGCGPEGTHSLQGVEPQFAAPRVRAAEGLEPYCHVKYDKPWIFILTKSDYSSKFGLLEGRTNGCFRDLPSYAQATLGCNGSYLIVCLLYS